MANPLVDDLSTTAKDAFYVGVGFGVLAIQQAQVQRRELTKQLKGQASDAREQLEKLSGPVEDQIRQIEERVDAVEDQVDDLLRQLERRLPDQAADVVKSVRGQVRSLVRTGRAA